MISAYNRNKSFRIRFRACAGILAFLLITISIKREICRKFFKISYNCKYFRSKKYVISGHFYFTIVNHRATASVIALYGCTLARCRRCSYRICGTIPGFNDPDLQPGMELCANCPFQGKMGLAIQRRKLARIVQIKKAGVPVPHHNILPPQSALSSRRLG